MTATKRFYEIKNAGAAKNEHLKLWGLSPNDRIGPVNTNFYSGSPAEVAGRPRKGSYCAAGPGRNIVWVRIPPRKN